MTATGARSRQRPQFKGEDAPHDSRPPIGDDVVFAALERAAKAIDLPATSKAAARAMTRQRLWYASPEPWGKIRLAFHSMPEAERRRCLVKLVAEEGERLAAERTLAWGPGAAHDGQTSSARAST